jgi:RNA polymerase sigma factor (sigma-70 family)
MTRSFPTTCWGLIATAAGETAAAQPALAELCAIYWPPVYAFVLRTGRGREDALDLTQGFFTRILEHNDLATADPRRGRFRAWLLGALKHFMANEARRARAQKRGGGRVFAIDDVTAESCDTDLACSITPTHLYARRWALTVLEHVLGKLEQEQAAEEKHRKRFELLKSSLVGCDLDYDALAEEVGQPAATLRVQVHRLRRRYHELLREEISRTVDTPADVEEEIRYLLAALI